MDSEHVNPVTLHRRQDDPVGADYHDVRRFEEREIIMEKPDAYTKWIVGVVGAGIITLLTVLAARDRQSVDVSLAKLETSEASVQLTLNAHEAQIQVIKVRQERVLADLEKIQGQLKDNGDKLDRLLLEMRRK